MKSQQLNSCFYDTSKIPAGPDKDMGGWTMSSFSVEQQEKFGVDAEGVVTDKTKHQAAIAQVNLFLHFLHFLCTMLQQ